MSATDAAPEVVSPDQIAATLARADRDAYFEQRIFIVSPFGTLLTAALLFVVAAGSFALASLADGHSLLEAGPSGPTPRVATRVAFILSLLVAAILGVQRYVLLRDRVDISNSAAMFRNGYTTVLRLTGLTPTGAKLGAAALIGVGLGAIIVWFTFWNSPDFGFASHPAGFVWFAAITILLTVLFARGVELTRRGSRSGRLTIDDELIIDLLRIDRLAFLGRSAARFALIWFTVAAVSCLFFVSSGITLSTIAMLVVFAAIGIWAFVAMMEKIHHKIRVAKIAELEQVRSRIDEVRNRAHLEGDAAQRLQGLLAYEARIAAAPEWPFDQTTLMRVGASALILTVPWFGQAIAAYLIEHLGPR